MAIRVRPAIPALISEQGWTVKDVMEHCSGASVPKEMRKEVVGIHKVHGITKAAKITGISMATISRWASGNLAGKGVLSMGNRTWARMEEVGSDENAGPRSTGGRKPKFSDSDVRKVVCAVLTGTTPEETAKAFGMSLAGVYKWRLDAVGKTNASDYAKRVKKFLDGVASEPEVADETHVPERTNKSNGGKPKSRKHKSLAVKEQAVHRIVNEGVPVDEVAEELGVTRNAIYSWRRQLLGKSSDSKFGGKSRALAKQFMTEARIDDQINGHAVPDPMASASSMLSEVATEGGARDHVGTMEGLSDKLARLDVEFESLGKDRKLVAQEIEIQQLRRRLSDR